MNRTAVWLFHALGIVCIGTALRRGGDLGDLLPLGAFIALLVIGGVAVYLAARPADGDADGDEDRRSPGVVVPISVGVAGLLLLPSATAVVLAAGGILAAAALVLAPRRARGRVLVVVTAVVAGAAVTWAIDQVMLMRVAFDLLAAPLATMLHLLGADTASAGDLVHVATLKTDQGFKADANTLGLAVHGLLGVHLVLLRWVGAGAVLGGTVPWWLPVAVPALAMLVRFVLFVGLGVLLESGSDYELTDFPYAGWFDWRCGLAIDGIAAVVAVSVLAPKSAVAAPPLRRWMLIGNWPRWALPAVAVAFGLGLAADRALDCTGTRKAGRIAIDERHSRWESSDIRVGRDTYGTESGYNFRGIADWLESIHGPIRRIYEPLSPATLADVDVLLVKTPTEPMAAGEVDAIHEYVAAGGGLVLIGDHTNVFGTSEILNRITQPMGFHFQYDCLFDQRRRFEFHYTTDAEVQGHPIMRGVAAILFEVGCSIKVNSSRVRPILVGRGLKSQPIDFGVENFYPKPEDTANLQTGQFPVVVARNWGRGRVAAVADSTLFSTFSVFMPGRREIVEGMVAYANRVDVGEGTRRLLRRLAWLMGVVLCAALRGRGLPMACAMAVLAWGSGHAAIGAAERFVPASSPAARDATGVEEVLFVNDRGTVDWGLTGFPEDADRCFELFFQYASRVGAFPRLVEGLRPALTANAPIVWIDPVSDDDDRTVRELVGFVEEGGSVIVMESTANPCVERLATALGLALQAPAAGETSRRLRTPFGPVEHRVPRPTCRTIRGGEPMIVSERSVAGDEGDERPVAVLVRRGRGHAVVMTCGQLFANSDYGFRYATIPDQSLRRLYETQYAIMAAAVRAEAIQDGRR